jgi:hypothetical protein
MLSFAAPRPDCYRAAGGLLICSQPPPPVGTGETSLPKPSSPTDNGSSTGTSKPSHTQGTLDASYTISFARIPVGEITASVVFSDGRIRDFCAGPRWGVMKVLSVDGEGSFTTRGAIKDGHPVPTQFTSQSVCNNQTSDVTIAFDEGSVRELAVTPPPSQDRVPVTAANRRGSSIP